MEIKIGENIKRLRKNRNLTQEQLAELMNVSCAAVSKWESCESYPDISMIFPLATLFKVSVDELMGYNSALVESEIQKTITEYSDYLLNGKTKEASELIKKARKKYPNDYRVMSSYMWNIAGGSADNSTDILSAHNNEFLQICDSILNGCTDEKLRLEAMTMKAKLYHASGNTDTALKILSEFPSWFQSCNQKTEQLYKKDSKEFRYWIRRNLYDLAYITSNKLIKTKWYDDNPSLEDGLKRCEAVADSVTKLREESGETVFLLMEFMAFSELSSKLTYFLGSASDVIRIKEKLLKSASLLASKTEDDTILSDMLKSNFDSNNPLEMTLNRFKNFDPPSLQKNKKYIELLEKYKR